MLIEIVVPIALIYKILLNFGYSNMIVLPAGMNPHRYDRIVLRCIIQTCILNQDSRFQEIQLSSTHSSSRSRSNEFLTEISENLKMFLGSFPKKTKKPINSRYRRRTYNPMGSTQEQAFTIVISKVLQRNLPADQSFKDWKDLDEDHHICRIICVIIRSYIQCSARSYERSKLNYIIVIKHDH